MATSSALKIIQTLDPQRDHQRIMLLSMRQDFPFDSTRSLELALFRTYCSPSISGLLDRTGQFAHAAQKRYDDTDILVSEVIEHGYESERGLAAIKRINALHGRFNISNDDYLYVLSTFVFEPIRWNERYGWRRLCEVERQAYFHFWREVGRRMGIKEIPAVYHSFERFSREYERTNFGFAKSNQRVGIATREMLAAWFPQPLRFIVRRVLYVMLDPDMRSAFGFPDPDPILSFLVPFSMRLRATMLRLLPKRTRPLLRTSMRHRTYREGYTIATLGPVDANQPSHTA